MLSTTDIRTWLVLALMLVSCSSIAAVGPVKPVRAEVRPHNGAPAIFINGKPFFANAFVAIDCANHKINKGMADAGIHIYDHSVTLGHRNEDKYDYSDCDDLLSKVVAADPHACFIIRAGTEVPGARKWLEKHPNDEIKWADGKVSPIDASCPITRASRSWLEDSSRDLAAFIKHIRSGPYADRVLGIFLCDVQGCEWFGPQLWEGWIGDFSEVSTQSFRQWLRAKYNTDEALRKAWKDPSMTFDTVTVPTPEERKIGGEMMRFRDPARCGMRITDWYVYYSDINADAIVHFAHVIKQASSGDMLAGFFYGYLNVFGPFQQESQHNAVTKLLNCPDIDFMGSPSHYAGRGPGGTSVFMTMADSIQLHGKIHFNESDIRTHLTNDPTGHCNTFEETAGVLKREVGHVLSRGQALWWADMFFGAFDDEKTLSLIKQLKTAGDRTMSRPRQGSAQIAVMIDDRSWSACRPGIGMETCAEIEWPRVGASQDYYVLSDIANPKLPKHKLYVFMNAYWLADREIEAIHKRLKKDHATALWLYAPGCVTNDGLSTKRMKALTGINLVCVPNALPTTIKMNASQMTAVFGGLTDPTGAKARGVDAPQVGPVFYADDPSVEVVGTLESVVKPGFVIKQMDGWRSVYFASPVMSPEALRAVAEYAGVHIYSRSNDCFYANRGIIALHARQTGDKLIKLPRKSNVFDLLSGEKIASGAAAIKIPVKANDTVLLRVE